MFFLAPANNYKPLKKSKMKKKEANQTVQLNVADCYPHPDNPHEVRVDEVKRLASSIEADGLKNPIKVVKDADGKYRILVGHTRHSAYVMLGWETIFAEVVEFETWEDEIKEMLISNMYREKSHQEKAIEMMHWKRIWAKSPGTRSDLIEEEGTERLSTRQKLAKFYGVSEATIGKYEYILENGKEYFVWTESHGLSLEAVYQLVRFKIENGIAITDDTQLMTKVIDETDSKFFSLIDDGTLTIDEAFQKCARLLGKKMKPSARPESDVITPILSDLEQEEQPDEISAASSEELSESDPGEDVKPDDELEQITDESNEGSEHIMNDAEIGNIADGPVNAAPPINLSEVEPPEAYFCDHEDCPFFGKRIK
jgi:hypothetical protein